MPEESLLHKIIANSPKVEDLPNALELGDSDYILIYIQGVGLRKIQKSAILFGGEPATSLKDLTDTPNQYLGQAGKILALNATEDAFVWVSLPDVDGVTEAELELALSAYVKTITIDGGTAFEVDEFGNINLTGIGGSYELTAQKIADALTYTPANDAEVVKAILNSNGEEIEKDELGRVTLPESTDFDDTAIQNTLSNHDSRITALEGAATPQEPISVVWNTGDPLTFSLPKAPSAVDINGSMLSKWLEDGVTPDEYSLSGTTVTLNGITPNDGSNIQFHFGATRGEITKQTLEDVIDFPRTILSSSNLLSGKKVRVLTGVYVTDANWRYVDLFPVELGQYSITGWFDTVYSVAAYDHEGGYIEGYPAPVVGSQTYSFTITNPKVKMLRVSTHSAGATFQFKKLDESVARKDLRTKLEIPDLKLRTVYVAKNGIDTNSGSKNFPFLTINAAINYIKNDGGTIVVKAGDYYETLNLKDVTSDLRIINFDFDKVRVMGSEIISGIIKTSGRTKIYEASFTGEILLTGNSTAYGYRIFEDNAPSKLIPSNERNALQRSQAHRLPFSEIKQIVDQGSLTANLDFLDALASGVSGYWKDTANNKIYIVNSNHTQPTSIHYAVRDGSNATVTNGITDKVASNISIDGIQFFYSKNIGIDLYRFNRVNIHQVAVFGSRLTGFNEQASRSVVNLLECGGCGQDGLASALYFEIPSDKDRNNEVWNTYNNIWLHDNNDDGFSVHQNGSLNITGFLFEYNGDCGLQNVGCSYSFVQNGLSRKNTKGIVINGAATASHSRASTSFDGYNITSEDNAWNYESAGDANTTPAVMNLYNCVSRNATSIGYRINGTNAIMKAFNCKSTGDATPNEGATVINDNNLV